MDWHDISDPNDPVLDQLAEKYKIHPLHIEDCRHRNQNAKVEEGRDYLFVVLKPVEIEPDSSLSFGDLDLIVGRDFLITVQETECASLRAIIAGTQAVAEHLRPDQVLYRIADRLVDMYSPVIDRSSETIEELEEQVLEDATPELLAKLFDIRRALIEMRRVLTNTREVMGTLYRLRSPLIAAELAPFLRDVYDHIVRALDTVDVQRDLITGVVEIYMSVMANRTNNAMKGLTVAGTLAVPAIVISGFYGMNLKHLPLVDHPHATGVIAGLLIVSTVVLLVVLRKMRWL